jgi:monooxygenase
MNEKAGLSAAKAGKFVDVLIVGAGLSGIGSARHLQSDCPERTFALLESRDSLGGTWDLFRYPGIRSDSDMYTLGYSFKPWLGNKSLADGSSILSYLRETAQETGVTDHIHYGRSVRSASWSSESATWTVQVERSDGSGEEEWRCNFLLMCSGYYNYEKGYVPEFDGVEDYQGQMFHAQHWPEDLDYADKRVVVVGSGATAVTLVPELAKDTKHTIMLQRSPTYIASLPERDALAERLRPYLPGSWVYRLTRWKRILFQIVTYKLARKRPKLVKRILLDAAQKSLGPDYDVKKHFTPDYNPWDQRICAIPDGDMFKAIREKRAEVVTDHIDRFVDNGVLLKSGQVLEADIVVLATGLNMTFMSNIALQVDEQPINSADLFTYRGMMFADVPNLAQVFGYTNASWTLKADLTADYVCRLLNHMKRHDHRFAVPRIGEGGVEEEPMMDFTSGYVQRAIGNFPKQGTHVPWRVYQNYVLDFFMQRFRPLRDKVLQFR